MIEVLLSGAVALLPWLFGAFGLAVLAMFGWRVGMPAVRILELRAQVDLLRVQLETAQEGLKAAQERENRCVARLEAATADLEKAHTDVRTLVNAIDIKKRLDTLASHLQPLKEIEQLERNPHYDAKG